MKSVFIVAVVALFAVGCSSTPNVVKEAQRAEKAAAKQVRTVISDIPKWYLSPPDSTAQVVFVTGTSSSTNLAMSRDKAILDAQRRLGDQLEGLVSSMTKSYIRDFGTDQTVTVEDTEQVTRKLVAEANVAGYRVENIKVQQEGRHFRTYVMLAYPIGETNTIRAMQERRQMMRNLPAQRQEAFNELDQHVEAVRD